MGVEKAELPEDMAESLISSPDIENPKEDPTNGPDGPGARDDRSIPEAS